MSSQKTLALTLRAVDFSETSQVVTAFSRDAGRLSLLAKGSRRRTRGIQGGIDLFQVLEVVYIEKSGALDLLTESTLVEDFPGLRLDLRRGYAAFYVAELLLSLTEEHDPNPPLFDLARATLARLSGTDEPNVAVHAFEAQMLALIGLLPRFDACASCGGAIEGTETAFAPGAGGALCARCAPQAAERLTVSRGALAVLARLAAPGSNKVERLRISGTIAAEVRTVLARVWLHVLGREPEMVKYLDSIPWDAS